jgi:hypothetical protein
MWPQPYSYYTVHVTLAIVVSHCPCDLCHCHITLSKMQFSLHFAVFTMVWFGFCSSGTWYCITGRSVPYVPVERQELTTHWRIVKWNPQSSSHITFRVLWLSQQCCWSFRFSKMWWCVTGWAVPTFLRIAVAASTLGSVNPRSCKRRHYEPPKCQELLIQRQVSLTRRPECPVLCCCCTLLSVAILVQVCYCVIIMTRWHHTQADIWIVEWQVSVAYRHPR